MSNHSHNDLCGHEAHDHDHDHDHDNADDGPRDDLLSRIDMANVVALNCDIPAQASIEYAGRQIFKPWKDRMDEVKFLESDSDDQLILHVPFSGSDVKIRAILLKSGPSGQTPTKICIYADKLYDFEDVENTSQSPTQEFEVPVSRDVGEYVLKATKFTNVSRLTVFFPAAHGSETTRIYYLAFLGQWTEHKKDPVITVYETQANLADHEKIQGMDGVSSSPQM